MGVALVTKRVIENLSKRLREGGISCLFHCRRHFCTLVTKRTTSILRVGSLVWLDWFFLLSGLAPYRKVFWPRETKKVGAVPMYQALKIRVQCG